MKSKVRASIVIPVLNSHEILRRQLIHFEKMGLPKDVEIIIVDDGSYPSLEYTPSEGSNLKVIILRTDDVRPWTWALARNKGARHAKGDWLIMYDLDHIIRKPLVDMVRKYDGHVIQFLREFGVLLENGEFTQNLDILADYGWPRSRFKTKRLTIPAHPNMFAIKRDVFLELGGYREDLITTPYPQGEDSLFKKARYRWIADGKGKIHPDRPTIYMFPNGKLIGDVDADPKGLFHNLTRVSDKNNYYKKQLKHYGKKKFLLK